MKSRIRDACFTLLGIAGLMVYVLGCAPSFSPDGTKVAFPVLDEQSSQTSIVSYDIKKKGFEILAVFSGTKTEGGEDEVLAYSVQWMPRGQQVLINGMSLISIVPVESHGPARTLLLNKEKASVPVLPPPVIGHYQYVFPKGDDPTTLLRVNLENWETKSISIIKPKGEVSSLFSDGKQLYYGDKFDNQDQTVYEIIKLNPENETQTVLLQLQERECGELRGFFRWNHTGDRLAIPSIYQDEAHIALIRGNSMERMIPVGAKGGRIEIGKLEWSTDEQSLFASFARRLDDEDNAEFGVIEVPLNGGKSREIPLFTGKLDEKGGELNYFQIALSPDGRQIAASSLSFFSESDEDIKPQDRALYLVDISLLQWEATKVPVPVPYASKAETGRR